MKIDKGYDDLKKIRRATDPFADQRYPVLWVQIPDTKSTFIGFCGYSQRPFNLRADLLSAIIIRDLFISKKGCEEEERCLNTDCKFNKTTMEGFLKHLGAKRRNKSWEKYWQNAQSYRHMTLTEIGYPKYEGFKEPGILMEKRMERRR